MKKAYMGNNEIHLNQATVMLAIQQYLDSIHVTGMAPTVTAVLPRDNLFVVRTSDKPMEVA